MYLSRFVKGSWQSSQKTTRVIAETSYGYTSPRFVPTLPPLMYRFLNRANGKDVIVRGYAWEAMVDEAALHIGLSEEKSYTAMSYRLDPSCHVEGAIVMKPKRKNRKKNEEDEDDE